MKIFELSNKKNRNGRRPIKVILHEIHPDNCISDKTGTMFNENGITWIEEYCKLALPSIKGMSLTVEFTDEERTQIAGHGETGVDDGLPTFENATMVGHFDSGTIMDIEINGVSKKVVVADGYIDEMRYKSFVDLLEEKYNNDEKTYGSVEIFGLSENDNKIKYLDGWKEKGRIPTEFSYSGFALLGVSPADKAATMVELNQQKESEAKSMEEIKNMLSELKGKLDETSECKKTIEKNNETISELNASVEQLREALAKVENERAELYQKAEETYEETRLLREEIAKAKVKEKLSELNAALIDFTDEEKGYVKEDLEAFNADPMSIEINSIVDKIHAAIGQKVKEEAKMSETNAKNNTPVVEDIFGDIHTPSSTANNEVSIF